MALRRRTVGGMPSFGVTLHSLDISDDELNDPGVKRLEILAQEMLILANVSWHSILLRPAAYSQSQDICSYNVEQSRGDSHNAVAVVMHHNNLSVQEAIDFIARMFHESAEEFLKIMETSKSPSEDLRTYISGLGYWVRGNFEMSFEIERYGLNAEARKGGSTELLSKQDSIWSWYSWVCLGDKCVLVSRFIITIAVLVFETTKQSIPAVISCQSHSWIRGTCKDPFQYYSVIPNTHIRYIVLARLESPAAFNIYDNLPISLVSHRKKEPTKTWVWSNLVITRKLCASTPGFEALNRTHRSNPIILNLRYNLMFEQA